MRILFLSRWFPFPINNGSNLRVSNLLRGLTKHYDVTLLSFADQPDVRLDAPEIREICTDAHVVPWREFDPNSARAWSGFFSFKPRSIVDTFSTEMAEKIKYLINTRKYDLIIASQLPMAAYHPYFENIPAIFEEAEIGLSYGEAHYSSNLSKRIRHTFTWFKLRMYLSQLIASFQACTVVSEKERELIVQHIPKASNIHVIPNCMKMDEYKDIYVEPKPNTLIFTGSFRYHANYQAMRWFLQEVYPKIVDQIPEAHLVITGDHAGLKLPPAPNVTLTGYVNDIKSLTALSWVSIAPLLSGGGTRLKILEAMAIGTPVVSTSKGAEGLDLIPDEHLLIADAPESFSDQVIGILKNKTLRSKLSVNGRQLVKEKYNWEIVMPNFLHLVESVMWQSKFTE